MHDTECLFRHYNISWTFLDSFFSVCLSLSLAVFVFLCFSFCHLAVVLFVFSFYLRYDGVRLRWFIRTDRFNEHLYKSSSLRVFRSPHLARSQKPKCTGHIDFSFVFIRLHWALPNPMVSISLHQHSNWMRVISITPSSTHICSMEANEKFGWSRKCALQWVAWRHIAHTKWAKWHSHSDRDG